MTDTVNVPQEVLERIAAADFEGVFCYEENPQYEGTNTSGHIIRYRPRQQPPAPDGSRSVKLSFPVLAAASWLDDVESVLPVFAEFLTYAPALAKAMLAAAPKVEPITGSLAEMVTELVNETAPDQGQTPSRAFALALSLQAAIASQPEAPKVEQEPVAYVSRKGFTTGGLVWTKEGMDANLPDETKLYTHPAPASDELLEALEAIKALDGEINENNYTHDDVCELNNAFVEAWGIADRAIAKHKGPQS